MCTCVRRFLKFCQSETSGWHKTKRVHSRYKAILNENHFYRRFIVIIFAFQLRADPKAVLRLDDTTVTLVPEKIRNPFGMQIMFDQEGHTRNIYVYAENSRDLVNWYTCIRSAKLNRYRIAYPGTNDDEVCNQQVGFNNSGCMFDKFTHMFKFLPSLVMFLLSVGSSAITWFSEGRLVK